MDILAFSCQYSYRGLYSRWIILPSTAPLSLHTMKLEQAFVFWYGDCKRIGAWVAGKEYEKTDDNNIEAGFVWGFLGIVSNGLHTAGFRRLGFGI